MANDPTPKKGYMIVKVRGEANELWAKLRPKLIKTVNDVLDTVIDESREATVRTEAKEFTSALLDFAKQRLRKEGLEAEKIEAEVRKLHADMQMGLAEARERHARADHCEFDLKVKKLRLALSLTKAQLIGDEGEEAIVFGRQIDELLKLLKELSATA